MLEGEVIAKEVVLVLSAEDYRWASLDFRDKDALNFDYSAIGELMCRPVDRTGNGHY